MLTHLCDVPREEKLNKVNNAMDATILIYIYNNTMDVRTIILCR